MNDIVIYCSVGFSLISGMLLFFLLPVWLGNFFRIMSLTWGTGCIEGLIRIAIFLLYVQHIQNEGDTPGIPYHGAEHKTINCFESEKGLTVENVRACARLHDRCGTTFMFIVMVISMVVFFVVRTDDCLLRFVTRIVLVPVVAGISYESHQLRQAIPTANWWRS
ncbi:MAG: DUF1385 domain-containing protein [Anaerotignum sp.]